MEVKLAAGQPFDNEHDAGACWTAQAGRLVWNGACRYAEQHAAALERDTSVEKARESRRILPA